MFDTELNIVFIVLTTDKIVLLLDINEENHNIESGEHWVAFGEMASLSLSEYELFPLLIGVRDCMKAHMVALMKDPVIGQRVLLSAGPFTNYEVCCHFYP